MAPVILPLGDPSGPPTNTQGLPLESLTSSQNEQDCSEILEGILTQVVSCSEEGTHGPTLALTSCESATCSLGVVDPPADLALAISTLETYSPGPVLRAWDRSLKVRARSQINNYSGTGPRVYFWYIFLNFIIHFSIALSKFQDALTHLKIMKRFLWLFWCFMQIQAYFIFSWKIIFYYWGGQVKYLGW